MQYIELVAVADVLQFFFFGERTGKARRDSGLKLRVGKVQFFRHLHGSLIFSSDFQTAGRE